MKLGRVAGLWVCWALSVPGVSAGVVEEWNATFLQAVRKETPPPCLVSRNLTIFHLGIHRAVEAARAAGLDVLEQNRAAFFAAEGAFQSFFPGQSRMVEEVRAAHPEAATVDGVSAQAALKIAEAAVARCFKEREDDGCTTTVHYVPQAEPGQWRRTPPSFRPPEFPHWGAVKPFAIDRADRFRAPPPPELDSAAYARDFNEVRELGGKTSAVRTVEQTLIARFWADFSYTTSPPGHWNDIARKLSLARSLEVGESARLFAQINIAMADTCIVVWKTKYHYNYWRPVTAIRRADEDGNPATSPDKAWLPLLESPPHPEYVSGHSAISGAASALLESFFGTDDLSFSVESDDVKGIARHFTSLRTCAEEIARSRIYAGIHFTSSGRAGLALGREVAGYVYATKDK